MQPLLDELKKLLEDEIPTCEVSIGANFVLYIEWYGLLMTSLHIGTYQDGVLNRVQKIGRVRYDSTKSYPPRRRPRGVRYQIYFIPKLGFESVGLGDSTDIPS